MYTYSQYCISTPTAITANINYLPTIRQDIIDALTDDNWTMREPCIVSVDMRAAGAFTVSFNDRDTLIAEEVGNEFVIKYSGSIQYILSAASVTLTYLKVEWFKDRENHFIPTYTTQSDSTITRVTDDYGDEIPPCDTGEWELQEGVYRFAVANSGAYADMVQRVVYRGEDDINLAKYQTLRAQP